MLRFLAIRPAHGPVLIPFRACRRPASSVPFADWIDTDGKIILLEKTVRTAPYGFLGVLYGVYLDQLGFSPLAVGVVLTLTVLSSALYTFVISFVADSIGRRRTLVFFAL